MLKGSGAKAGIRSADDQPAGPEVEKWPRSAVISDLYLRPWLMLAVLLIASTAVRLMPGFGRVFWLDEVWTGMIASQESITAFIARCSSDINAPLYYALAAIAGKIGGFSNFSLRLPAILLGVLTPFLALLPQRVVETRTRYIWCALLACWLPGLMLTIEARYYSAFIVFGCLNAAAFAAMLYRPTVKRALIWATISSLFILCHYYALILVGLQVLVGLAYLSRSAFRLWPAAFAFLPAIASLSIHANALIGFAAPNVSWIQPLSPSDVVPLVSFIAGSAPILLYLLLWGALGLYLGDKAGVVRPRFREFPRRDRAIILTIACSGGAVCVAILLGFMMPILILRYILGFGPALLLGLAWLAIRFSRYWRSAPLFLIAPYVATLAAYAAVPQTDGNPLSWEAASLDLMAHNPQQLVFMWDNPMSRTNGQAQDDEALTGVAAFFFKRAGHPVSVTLVRPNESADPNLQLLRAAKGRGSAILWIYDRGVRGTSALQYPPRIAEIDPRWQCRNYGSQAVGIIACHF